MSTPMTLELTLEVSIIRERGGGVVAVARETGVVARAENEAAAVEKNQRMHDIVFANLRGSGLQELIKFVSDRGIPFRLNREEALDSEPVWTHPEADGRRNVMTRQETLV